MQKLKLINCLWIISTLITVCCTPKTTTSKGTRIGETVEVRNKAIDWEAYDDSSTTPKTGIDYEDLQGDWKAYRGVYKFGELVNGMELTEPIIIEVKEDKYRRNNKSEFESFQIQNNLLLKGNGVRIDSGVVNKITPSELTISWKNKSNYTRYYYRK